MPRYRPAHLLGEDRLGTLWNATDLWSGRTVALRVLDDRLTSAPDSLHRATTQLRAVQRDISNRHVARLLDFDLSPRRHQPAFLVFEGAPGETLARRLQRRALPVHEALRLIAGVADGLASAHAARIYHSALTPESVLVGDDGVRVIDFGLAELSGGPDERGRTGTVTSLRDRGAADVLAVGLLFEQLLGGTHPGPSLLEREGPRGLEGEMLLDAEDSLRRARSPYWSQRPHMAELAAALAPALESAPLLEGAEHDQVPVRLDLAAPAPVAQPAEALPAAPLQRSSPAKEPAPTRPAAAETPAKEPAPARPAAAKTPAETPAKEPAPARPAATETPAEEPAPARPAAAETPAEEPATARPAAAKTPAETPAKEPAPARPAAAETPAKEPAVPARPAAAERPAKELAPARPAAAETHRGSVAEEPSGSGRAVSRRTRVLMLAAAVAAVAIGVVTLMPSSDPPGEDRSGPPSSGAAQVSPSTSATGVIVPDVLGLSAMEARRMLAEAGLVVTDADPAPGAPGEVVGTDPPSSQIVDAGTSITLLVGASPERLEPTPYVNGPGGYAFRTPARWELREVGPLAEIVSPDGDIVITFERRARGSLEVASERLVASLLETRSNSELIGQRRELIGDSPALLVSGTAREDTGEAIRFLAITVRGEPRSYAISIVVPAGSNPEQVLPRIEEIVTSFRPLDAEDS